MTNRKAIESTPKESTSSSATRRCTRCSTIGYSGDRFCPCCGMTLPKRCGSCDALVLHPLARYCTMCGAALDETTQRTNSQ